MCREVIFRWTHVRNSHGFWGLADILRGILSTHTFCMSSNYTFSLDISHHPVAKYLKRVNYNEDGCDPSIFVDTKNFKHYIQKNKSPVVLLTNAQWNDKWSTESWKNGISKESINFLSKLLDNILKTKGRL